MRFFFQNAKITWRKVVPNPVAQQPYLDQPPQVRGVHVAVEVDLPRLRHPCSWRHDTAACEDESVLG